MLLNLVVESDELRNLALFTSEVSTNTQNFITSTFRVDSTSEESGASTWNLDIRADEIDFRGPAVDVDEDLQV